jgi:hypothetical protein
MIQRIQSLYLLLIIIGCICLFFFPIGTYNTFDLTLLSANQQGMTIPLILIVLAIIVLSGVIIFLYKNRTKQLKLSRILILINILLIVVIFFSADRIEKQTGITTKYGVSAVIPLINILLSFLASRGIRKDEKLVKSSDRLR